MSSPPTPASYSAQTSVLGKNLLVFREMLAAASSVRDVLNATDEAEALERIYVGCLPRPENGDAYTITELNQYRPFMLIGPGQSLAIRSQHQTFGGMWEHNRMGEFDVMVERQHPQSGQDDVNDLDWINAVDRIRQTNDAANPGLLELHETAGNLSIRQVDVLDIYRGTEEEQQALGDYQRATIRVYWGRT